MKFHYNSPHRKMPAGMVGVEFPLAAFRSVFSAVSPEAARLALEDAGRVPTDAQAMEAHSACKELVQMAIAYADERPDKTKDPITMIVVFLAKKFGEVPK